VQIFVPDFTAGEDKMKEEIAITINWVLDKGGLMLPWFPPPRIHCAGETLGRHFVPGGGGVQKNNPSNLHR
jgi:hypothetical protein